MREERLIKGVQFYMKNEVNTWLFNKYESRGDAGIRFNRGDDFCYDIIDQPFHCALKSEEGNISIFLYIRSELGHYSEDLANLSIVFHTNGDKPTVKNRGGLGGDVSATIMHFLKAGVQLREHILDNGLMDSFADLDLEKEGILIKLVDDNLFFERVSGKKRPAMACTSLFGGIQMKRPYQDEIMDSWMGEMMSFEDKLEAAEEGDEDAMGEVAVAYLNGDEEEHISPDPEKAVFWFRKQAELDNPTGQFNLAIQYLKGEGVEQSFEQALYWMRRAEENGDDDAPAHVEKYSKIIELQTKANNDDVAAMSELAGEFMSLGLSLGENYGNGLFARCLTLAQKAAAANNPEAMWILALAYDHGRGVQVDKKMSIEYYQKGADLDHAGCQNSLGIAYIQGENVPENKEKGFALCLQSAEQGYAPAMKTVGTCYQFGHGVNDNMKSAIYWYEKYLEVADDPELAQKVMIFKTLPDMEEDNDSEWEPPTGYMDALKHFADSEEEEEPISIIFKDKIFVLTGFDTRKENQITEIITSKGGIIKSSTVLNTDYLIYDERGGQDTAKHRRALELNSQGKNIQIIPGRRFLISVEQS